MALPPLLTYSSVRAHALPLADLAPLMDGVVSVSANAMRYHASGGLERTTLVEALAVCTWRSLFPQLLGTSTRCCTVARCVLCVVSLI